MANAKKILFIIFIGMFLTQNIFCQNNPNWDKGVTYTPKDKISPYLWAPKSITVDADMTFFCYDAALNSIFDYSLSCTAMLSRMFNISAGIASRNFEKYPDTFYAKLQSHPSNFFSFQIDYRSQIFPEYKMATHNLVTAVDFYVDLTKWVDFHILTAGAFIFKDIDTTDVGTKYKQDWFFNFNLMVQLRLFVHPLHWFSFGTVFGNYSDYEVRTLDTWQCDTVCEFYPTENKNLALIVKFSVVNCGGFNFAGFINRLALTFGGRYAFKI